MKKIAYYLILGLVITALEVKTVEAQGADPNMSPPTGEPSGPPPTGDPNMPPPTGAPGGPPQTGG